MSEVPKGLFDEPEPMIEPLDEWYPALWSSDLPRTPSEAINQSKDIERRQRGISKGEATAQVAEQLRQIDNSAADNHL